jgi:hypothetical protein
MPTPRGRRLPPSHHDTLSKWPDPGLADVTGVVIVWVHAQGLFISGPACRCRVPDQALRLLFPKPQYSTYYFHKLCYIFSVLAKVARHKVVDKARMTSPYLTQERNSRKVLLVTLEFVWTVEQDKPPIICWEVVIFAFRRVMERLISFQIRRFVFWTETYYPKNLFLYYFLTIRDSRVEASDGLLKALDIGIPFFLKSVLLSIYVHWYHFKTL